MLDPPFPQNQVLVTVKSAAMVRSPPDEFSWIVVRSTVRSAFWPYTPYALGPVSLRWSRQVELLRQNSPAAGSVLAPLNAKPRMVTSADEPLTSRRDTLAAPSDTLGRP